MTLTIVVEEININSAPKTHKTPNQRRAFRSNDSLYMPFDNQFKEVIIQMWS